jgi:hypothetical protein
VAYMFINPYAIVLLLDDLILVICLARNWSVYSIDLLDM